MKQFPEAAELLDRELSVGSTRVHLSDVKLKIKDGNPVLLGRGGFGRVRKTLRKPEDGRDVTIHLS